MPETRQRRQPPERVGPYCIAGRLGGGGMGEVYRAFDERLNRWVAIKQLLPEVAVEAAPRERFRREARAVASLNHPVVVQIYDLFEDDLGDDWIVMELVEGEALKELAAKGPLEPARAIALGRQIAEGLAAAHDRGIVHRDLKIENVMVTVEGRVKILDFGLAKDFAGDSQSDSSISSSGALLGTSRAMSPEQAMGLTVDQRSDLFSLGTLLFEIVTGESPFRAATPILTLARVCNHHQPPAHEIEPAVPRALSSLIDQLLEKDPEDRPQSAAEVVTTLASLGRQGGDNGNDPKVLALESSSLPTGDQRVSSTGRRDLSDAAERNSVAGPATRRPGADLRAIQRGSGTWAPRTSAGTDSRPGAGFFVKTLVWIALAERADLMIRLGEERAGRIFALARDSTKNLAGELGGLEMGRGEAQLLLFDRPSEAVRYALLCQSTLARLAADEGIDLHFRVAVHVGEVFLLRSPVSSVESRSDSLAVEGRAERTAARLLQLARPGQILLSREAFELSRRSLREDDGLRFAAHGEYRFADGEHGAVYEVGHPASAPFTAPPRPARLALRVALAAVFLVLTLAAVFYLRTALPARPSSAVLAVLGFENLSPHPEDAWLSTGLVEMLNAELAASEPLRMVPAVAVERMRRELGIESSGPLSGETLAAVRRNLGADYVVVGTYVRLGVRGTGAPGSGAPGSGASLTVLPAVQDTRDGQTLLSLNLQAPFPGAMTELVESLGHAIRERLGVTDVPGSGGTAARAALPTAPAARPHYAAGLELLRRLDATNALAELAKAAEIEPDYAPLHIARARAWDALGFEAKARFSARRAVETAAALPRREQLMIEAADHELNGRWLEAVKTYEILWGFFPDNLEYGHHLAVALFAAGQGGEAALVLAEARKLSAAREDPRLDVLAARLSTDPKKALNHARRASEMARRRGSPVLTAEALRAESQALILLGEAVDAASRLEEARDLLRRAGERRREAETASALGLLAADRGELARAEAFMRQALALYRELGHRGGLAVARLRLAFLMERQGGLAAAAESLNEGLNHAAAIEDSRLLWRGRERLAWVRAGQGRLQAARRLVAELAAAPSDPRLAVGRDLVAGEVALIGGEMLQARTAFESALAASLEARLDVLAGLAYDRLGQVDLWAGHLVAARECFDRAAAIRGDLRREGSLAVTRLARARLLLAERRPENAARIVDLATEIFERQGRRDDLLRAEALRLETLLARGRLVEARDGVTELAAGVATSENPALRLEVDVLAARIRAADGAAEGSRPTLRRAAEEAHRLELFGIDLAARVALAEVEAGLGLPQSGERLERLRAEAEASGFGLLAKRSTPRRSGLSESGPASDQRVSSSV